MRAGLLAMIVAVAATLQAASASAQSPDYEFFKARIEPIFLKKKPGHTRCYVCHAESNNAFRLEKLPPGAKFWTEEQSRRNFETVSRLVVPGNFAASRLLFMPLAPEAGGNAFHNGGRPLQFKGDPPRKTREKGANRPEPGKGKETPPPSE